MTLGVLRTYKDLAEKEKVYDDGISQLEAKATRARTPTEKAEYDGILERLESRRAAVIRRKLEIDRAILECEDDLDRKILLSVRSGATLETTADTVYLSRRAVSKRLRKIALAWDAEERG